MVAKQSTPSPLPELEYASEEAQDLVIELAEQQVGIVYSAELPRPASRATRTQNVYKMAMARVDERQKMEKRKAERQGIAQDKKIRAAMKLGPLTRANHTMDEFSDPSTARI